MTIKRMIKKIGGSLLPDSIILRSKRVIFMTTLYLKMSQRYNASVSLEECNRQLGLVENVDALKLPAALQNKVWKDDKQETFDTVAAAISNGDTSSVSQAVMSITPAWLKYDVDTSLMENDIDTIVGCVAQRRSAMG